MKILESWILSYLLNSLWQVPLLFAAGWFAAQALRPAGAAAEHRVWVSTLLLQSLLPACSMLPWEWLGSFFAWGRHAGMAGEAHVSVVMGAGVAAGMLHLPAALLAATASVYSAVSAYFAARFLWRSRALSALRRESVEVSLTSDAAVCWARCLQRFGIGNASVAASSRIFGPVTLGLHRKLVLLPAGMVTSLPKADLRAVIAHEFAHMHRNDFLKNLLYELLSLPVSYHPLCWLTRARITESREMVCDRMAAECSGRKEYAQSLLRLASLLLQRTTARTPHAIGIFDANTFERRLMKLAEKQKEIQGMRRVAIIIACTAFGVATCGSALALRMHVDAASASTDSSASKTAAPTLIHVSGSVMAGTTLTKVQPKYPEEAKKAKVQGTVRLSAIIGKDGAVKNLRVVSGPKELRSSSLDAVRQWTYKPYLLNGEPVEVKTTVNVIYSLAG